MISDLRTYLLSVSGISSIVSDRIYNMKLPQAATFPSLTLTKISNQRSYSHSGPNIQRPRVQISCWAALSGEVDSLADEVITALSGYKGAAGSITIQDSFIDNEQDMWDEEAKIYHKPLDVLIRI